MHNSGYKIFFVFFLLVSLFPAMVLGEWLPERTGPGCIACDPETDFAEVFLIKNWKKLPHKNQEESQSRVDEVNSIIKKGKWKYRRLVPVLACLSLAASTAADWWAIEYGWAQESYDNFYNGHQENGFNPRELEALYMHRSKGNWLKYPIVPIPDLVHRKPFPAANIGFARIFSNQKMQTLQDPILNYISYSYSKNKYPFKRKWLRFKRKLKSNKRYTKELVSIIRSHGPMLAQVEYSKYIRSIFPGVHGVVIVGYGKPIDNPDETVFIIHDSYGDHPKDYGTQVEGGPSYKYIKAKYLQSVIVFPHRPEVDVKKVGENFSFFILNKAKKPLNVFKFAIWDAKTNKPVLLEASSDQRYVLNPNEFTKDSLGNLHIYIAAESYMKSPGKGFWFKFKP